MKLTRNVKKALSILLTAVLIACMVTIVFGDGIRSEAIFDENSAITYASFASKKQVENSVLFIGTYIVHKDALNDQLYEKAKNSASESGQSDVYYKSELSDGKWFNIGDIDNGIKGISTQGLPEAQETIDPLYVTYYVGADGIMVDAKTLGAVNPFDIPDPYDLSKLPELEPIWTRWQTEAMTDSRICTGI